MNFGPGQVTVAEIIGSPNAVAVAEIALANHGISPVSMSASNNTLPNLGSVGRDLV